MPFAMFDQQKAKVEANELQFPCTMQILCEISMGGQNKAVLNALSMHVVDKKPAAIEETNIDKNTGEILPNKDQNLNLNPNKGTAQTTSAILPKA